MYAFNVNISLSSVFDYLVGWVRKADLAQVEDAPRFMMRRLRPGDAAAVADIIRTVMPEFGADGPGFAIHDAEVGAMHAAYSRSRAAYFVIEVEGTVLGDRKSVV